MKKLWLTCAVCVCLLTSMIAEKSISSSAAATSVKTVAGNGNNNSPEVISWIDSVYTAMDLKNSGLQESVFFDACKGYEYLLSQNALAKPGILTVCDYSQCSSKKRLYVLDLINGKILFNTYVAHGHNSGNDYASSFSNSDESHKSSLGFMVTAETYIGDNGYSMHFDGLENGFNNNVRSRSIVMHGCDYVNAQRAASGTMMGRSFGCPAVPENEVRNIVDCIKNGSCFFSYFPDKQYTQTSQILNASFNWPLSTTMLAAVKTPDTLKKIEILQLDFLN